MTQNLIVLTRYGALGASSRLRFLQYLPFLRVTSPTFEVTWQPLLNDSYLRKLYAKKSTRLAVIASYARRAWFLMQHRAKPFEVLWIEKELWPWVPAWLELWALGSQRYVMDLDDAIFHNYDMHAKAWVRRAYGRKIDKLMRHASLVVAGNAYLAARAVDAGAKHVRVLPTVIDPARYASMTSMRPNEPVRVVWIGSMSTATYLQDITKALQAVAARHSVELLVIGASISIPGLVCRCVPWQEDTETQAIAQGDIGIMPLRDSPWELGKCGYKLIQYMGCGLPVVASAVGANMAIVDHERNGFLVTNISSWTDALTALVQEPSLRQRMGREGRHRMEAQYSLTVTAPSLHRWLCDIARGEAPLT
jgi:glycosyltransferase involved in cell wall biosynthesis